jgi:hypothetical protein
MPTVQEHIRSMIIWNCNNRYIEETNRWRHSGWLSFMEKRPVLAGQLLNADSVLIVTIDEREIHHLGVLPEQILHGHSQRTTSIAVNPENSRRAQRLGLPFHAVETINESSAICDQDSAALVSVERGPEPERLVKSVKRVRDLGEVLTPAATVQAMLDLLPDELWQPRTSATFFEPACGDGNFLVAILHRKLHKVSTAYHSGLLPAGSTPEAVEFHAFQALASIYAVDISVENVLGGTPGHEIGARERMLMIFRAWYHETLDVRLTVQSAVLTSAEWIVNRNILVGNMLATNADGSSSGRDALPLVEYNWDLATRSVAISRTTLGAAIAAASAKTTGRLLLLCANESAHLWRGAPVELHKARIPAPPVPKTKARNRNGTRTG